MEGINEGELEENMKKRERSRRKEGESKRGGERRGKKRDWMSGGEEEKREETIDMNMPSIYV